jgi:YHS domain-containing protein
MQNPLRIERSAGAIILAENKTKLKKVRLNNVILKGYDPVAYFNQGKAVMGNPFITSTYNGATYLFASREDKAEFDKSPAKFEPQYGGYCARYGRFGGNDKNRRAWCGRTRLLFDFYKQQPNLIGEKGKPCSEWGRPAGKYHRSPSFTSATCGRPSWSRIVTRQLP